MKGFGQNQDLTLSQQLLFLKANPAVGGEGTVRANKLTWQVPIQPSALARSYLATITYRLGQTPNVQLAAIIHEASVFGAGSLFPAPSVSEE